MNITRKLLKQIINRVMMNEQEHIQDENETQDTTAPIQAEELSIEDSLANQLVEASDKYARLFAEFDNYKKRTSRERVELIQTAGQGVISKLLPVLDDFDRALVAIANAQDIEGVKEGIDLVNQKFRKLLENEGLKEMETTGQPFDADFQEAITSIPAPSEDLKNKVIDTVEKGYFLNDKVIRFAKVVIGQ